MGREAEMSTTAPTRINGRTDHGTTARAAQLRLRRGCSKLRKVHKMCIADFRKHKNQKNERKREKRRAS